MKAAVLYGKEDVRIERVDIPVLGPGDILLRSKVALTCGTDVKVFSRGYHARMIVPPALFGHEVAGSSNDRSRGRGVSCPAHRWWWRTPRPAARSTSAAHDMPSLCDDLLFWNGATRVREDPGVVRQNLIPLEDGWASGKRPWSSPRLRGARIESWIGGASRWW
jgi:L-iditol 2-dehydrogenase